MFSAPFCPILLFWNPLRQPWVCERYRDRFSCVGCGIQAAAAPGRQSAGEEQGSGKLPLCCSGSGWCWGPRHRRKRVIRNSAAQGGTRLAGAKGEIACRIGTDRAFALTRHPHCYGAIQRKGPDVAGGQGRSPTTDVPKAEGQGPRAGSLQVKGPPCSQSHVAEGYK